MMMQDGKSRGSVGPIIIDPLVSGPAMRAATRTPSLPFFSQSVRDLLQGTDEVGAIVATVLRIRN